MAYLIFIVLLFALLIGLIIGLIYWIYKIYLFYHKGNLRRFKIHIVIFTLLFVFVTWNLQIFPLSKNFYIKGRTTQLTGKSFWSWKEYSYDEFGVRGEGYTLDIYKFSEETADYFMEPDSSFFSDYPNNNNLGIKWTPTPVKNSDIEILEFATPVYVGWKGKVVQWQDNIREIATRKGSYYAYKRKGGTDFYIISPEDRLVILINHNM